MKNAKDTLRLAFEQMQEDRKTIKDSYDKYSEQVETLADYMGTGLHLNKCLELLTKQTAQLLELAKLQGAGRKQTEESLSPDDRNEIYGQLTGGYQ